MRFVAGKHCVQDRTQPVKFGARPVDRYALMQIAGDDTPGCARDRIDPREHPAVQSEHEDDRNQQQNAKCDCGRLDQSRLHDTLRTLVAADQDSRTVGQNDRTAISSDDLAAHALVRRDRTPLAVGGNTLRPVDVAGKIPARRIDERADRQVVICQTRKSRDNSHKRLTPLLRIDELQIAQLRIDNRGLARAQDRLHPSVNK